MMNPKECAGFVFFSTFDSGNLHSVAITPTSESMNVAGDVDVPDYEFNLLTKRDCAGTDFENTNRTWFYFGVKSPKPNQLVRFNMVDLNKQVKLYKHGMLPVYRVFPNNPAWKRIDNKPVFNITNDVFTISFKYRTPESIESVSYLAFMYPFTFDQLQAILDIADKRNLFKDDIYYLRECVCLSLEGRRTELITITSKHNMVDTKREPRLRNLFLDRSVPRPHRFLKKKIIFVSARVHPGETPSSFVLNGLMNLLMDREDPVAIQLRSLYVFKFMPCLNPDGVAMGHFRTDSRGVDLNRMYANPQFEKHPTIYAARSLIRYYHYGIEKEEHIFNDEVSSDSSVFEAEAKKAPTTYWCNRCNVKVYVDPDEEQDATSKTCKSCGMPVAVALIQGDHLERTESDLFLYIDMHAHTARKGIFMYGNHFEDINDSVECMLLPKLMSLNNSNFHFTTCKFTERNMYVAGKKDGLSKIGSGRVAVYKLTGLVRSYTLECNYFTGKLLNILPPTRKDILGQKEKTKPNRLPPIYTPQIFEEVGRAIGASVLDLTGDNPIPRLPYSKFHTLGGLKMWLRNLYVSGNVRHMVRKAKSSSKKIKKIKNRKRK